MHSNLRGLIVQHPISIFTTAAFVLSYFAIGPSSQAIPITLLVVLLRSYSRILIPRKKNFVGNSILLLAAISVGSSAAQASPSLHALSSRAESIVLLFFFSLLSAFVALATTLIECRVRLQLRSSWSQAALLPALWAIAWAGIANVSPLGRLGLWSPSKELSYYNWLLQWTGPAGIDWIVGAWAVCLATTAEAWFMAEPQPILVDIDDSHEDSGEHYDGVVWLFAILVALSIPSFFLSHVPVPYESRSTTPLQVGCIIPSYHRYKDRRHDLGAFVNESKKLNGANILLWPEGAVTFTDAAERDAAFEQVRNEVHGPIVGVSFEERFNDPKDPGGRTSRRRTGLALITHDDPNPPFIYYKRHLVPVAESFSLVQSTAPPSIFTYRYKAPKDYNKTEWAPNTPDHARPVSLTSSICLDFAIPAPFQDLESRPALILGPARTWHTAVGLGMWQQAKHRASEIGSTLLWCDGGDGGVSGVASRGITEVTQMGEGSWVRQIAVPWPLDERVTLYGRTGDSLVCLFLSALVALGWVRQQGISAMTPRRASRWVISLAEGMNAALGERRRRFADRHKYRNRGDPQETTNLLG